jgi:pilus assembly protein CpaF
LHGFSADLNAVRRFIAGAVDMVVHMARRGDGTRIVAAISEITGMENGIYMLREIFAAEDAALRRKGMGR